MSDGREYRPRVEKRYSDAEARDRDRNRYIQSATEVDYESGSYMGRVKDQYLGRKSRYQFICQRCETPFITEEHYMAQESSVVAGARWRMRRRIQYAVAGWARQIPYIGQFLAGGVMGAPRVREESDHIKGKRAAFEAEMKDQLHYCEECGDFVCTRCFQNGLCQSCVEARTKEPKGGQGAAPTPARPAPAADAAGAEGEATRQTRDAEPATRPPSAGEATDSAPDSSTQSADPESGSGSKLEEWQERWGDGGRTDWSQYKK